MPADNYFDNAVTEIIEGNLKHRNEFTGGTTQPSIRFYLTRSESEYSTSAMQTKTIGFIWNVAAHHVFHRLQWKFPRSIVGT